MCYIYIYVYNYIYIYVYNYIYILYIIIYIYGCRSKPWYILVPSVNIDIAEICMFIPPKVRQFKDLCPLLAEVTSQLMGSSTSLYQQVSTIYIYYIIYI